MAYLAFKRGLSCLTYLLPVVQSCINQNLLTKIKSDTGKPERLEYAIDSYGNLCGVNNNWDGTGGPDLTSKTKLYYLNPLELLNPATVTTAKAICVEECPGAADVCNITQLPCRNPTQYR